MLKKLQTLFELHKDSRAKSQKKKLSRIEIKVLMERRRALRKN